MKAVTGSYSAVNAITVFVAFVFLSLICFVLNCKNEDCFQIKEDKIMENTVNRLALAVVKISRAVKNTSLVAAAVWP